MIQRYAGAFCCVIVCSPLTKYIKLADTSIQKVYNLVILYENATKHLFFMGISDTICSIENGEGGLESAVKR